MHVSLPTSLTSMRFGSSQQQKQERDTLLNRMVGLEPPPSRAPIKVIDWLTRLQDVKAVSPPGLSRSSFIELIGKSSNRFDSKAGDLIRPLMDAGLLKSTSYQYTTTYYLAPAALPYLTPDAVRDFKAANPHISV